MALPAIVGALSLSSSLDLTSAGNAVAFPIAGTKRLSLSLNQITGSGATLAIDGSRNGGTTWVSTGLQVIDYDLGTALTALVDDGDYRLITKAFTHIQLRVVTAGSGSALALPVSLARPSDTALIGAAVGGSGGPASSVNVTNFPATQTVSDTDTHTKLDTLNTTLTAGAAAPIPAGTNVIGAVTQPTTTYAKASAASSLVVKGAAGSLTVAYAIPTAAGWLIAIDATAAPSSGASVTPIGLWPCVANQQAGGSYTDAPIPFTAGLVLLVSSSATVYTPVSATFLQGGAR